MQPTSGFQLSLEGMIPKEYYYKSKGECYFQSMYFESGWAHMNEVQI